MPTRAVLFDFGGTLYDYRVFLPGDQECLRSLVEWAGIAATPDAIRQAQRDGMRKAFHAYLPRRYYLHRDMFRDAAIGFLEAFGVAPDPALLDRYRAMQW